MDRHIRSAARALGLGFIIVVAAGATPAPDTTDTPLADTAATLDPHAPLSAAPDTLAHTPPVLAEEGVPYLAMMVKLGLGLALVVLLAWGTVFLLRKSAFGQHFGTAGNNIRVMERFYLGPKKAIYLVEIGGRALALGVTDTAITPLTQWQAGELEVAPNPAASPSFAAQFRAMLGAPRSGSQEG